MKLIYVLRYSLSTAIRAQALCWVLKDKAMDQKDKVPAFSQFNFCWGKMQQTRKPIVNR